MGDLYSLTEDQRLILYTVAANQRGSLAETRASLRLMDALELDSEGYRRAIANARTLHVMKPTREAFSDPELSSYQVAFDDEEAAKMVRQLRAWEGFSAVDVLPVLNALERLGDTRRPMRRADDHVPLFLSLRGQLRLLLFIKAQTGGIEQAALWYHLAARLALDFDQCTALRLRYSLTGIGWDVAALESDELRSFVINRSEALALLSAIHASGEWQPSDLSWLPDVLMQLEARPDEESGDAALSTVQNHSQG